MKRFSALPGPGRRVVTFGAFDGIHLGHRALINRAREGARLLGAEATVLTFEPHPARVLRPASAPARITTLADRAERIEAAGADSLVVLPFDASMAALSAEEFVGDVLVAGLGTVAVVTGPDQRFGRGRGGDAAGLVLLGLQHGFQVEMLRPVNVAGEPASSTRVRGLITDGRLAEANRVLGAPHRVSGVVVHGDHRGRTIGVPTANVAPETEVLPANGVYATRVRTPDGAWRSAVTNVGTRPTFEGDGVRIEAHLLDYEGDLYDQALSVDFVARIRTERRFDGLDALVAQIQADIQRARELLA